MLAVLSTVSRAIPARRTHTITVGARWTECFDEGPASGLLASLIWLRTMNRWVIKLVRWKAFCSINRKTPRRITNIMVELTHFTIIELASHLFIIETLAK